MSLLRSTKLVRYFTGAARTLILNAAKTTETTSLINPKTLSCTSNVLVRDYATSKKAEQLEPLLQKLDAEVRRFGRISKKDIDEVFDEIRSRNDITSTQSLLVIRCCGELVPEELPEQRTLLVQKIWNVLIERGIPMDISHYNALLRVYIENEHPFSPAKFLEELENRGLQPNRVTYQRLMWRYCQEGDVEGATKVLEKMRELNMPVSEPVLNALVMGHAFHGDTDGAKTVLETMAGAGLQPSNRTYTLLACGFARKGDIESVKDIIQNTSEKDSSMTDKDILEIIEHLAIGGHSDKVEQLFSYLQKNVGYNQDVCNLILRLLNKGNIETAKSVMKTMPKSTNVEDTIFKGAFFVKQLVKISKDSDSTIKILKELKVEELVPNALFIATEISLQLSNSELAQKLFKEIERDGVEIRQHYYWPLLVQKGKERDEEGLLHILQNMTNEGHIPNGETLRDYVIPYLINKDVPENVIIKLQVANVPTILSARNLMIELLESGKIKEAAKIALNFRLRGQYTLLSRSLINALNKTKDIQSFVSILHVTASNRFTPKDEEETSLEERIPEEKHSSEVGRLVRSAVKILSNTELIEELLTALHLKGIRIDTQSAEAIEQYLDKIMTTKISQLLTDLTSPELELTAVDSPRSIFPRTSSELERLLDQVKSKKGNNINKIQKQLLSAYINENNIEKLSSFLEELKKDNFELSPVTLSQLFEIFSLNNQTDKALAYQAQLKEKYPDFTLNKFKKIVLAESLIKSNKFDEAIQYLEKNKPTDEQESNSFMLNSRCWQILNNLAEGKDEEKVLKLTETLLENNYLEPTNIILGPSIKVFLLKDDLEGALNQFESFSKQYRCTPWKGELMKSLIIKEDANRLQWLADISTQIHGEVNILHDLVLAFVECGRLRQARRILETPGMHTKHQRLQNACQRYLEEGKSEYLEGLLEATKELSHIDRSNIFYHLLESYCRANETDKALGVWTLLQEQGEIPSNQFLTTLSAHLKKNKREVPFIIPEQKVAKTKERKAENTFLGNNTVVNKPTKLEISNKIESLIQNGKVTEASDAALKALMNNMTPKSAVIKYLLKTLAENAYVDKIQELGTYFSESYKKQVTYDDKLTLAVFRKGDANGHVDNLLEQIQKASEPGDYEQIVRKFPRSLALVSIFDNEELLTKCQKVADIAAQKGYLIPVNLLWTEYILAGNEKEADGIWNQWLINAQNILFRRLLQESFERKDSHLVEKLIKTLDSNKNVTLASKGNAYSRLINLHLSNNNTEAAENVLKEAITKGLKYEHFNKNCVERLKGAVEQSGKSFIHFK